MDRDKAQRAINMVATTGGNVLRAATKFGLARDTLRTRLHAAGRMGLKPNGDPIEKADDADHLRARIRLLESEVAAMEKRVLTDMMVKQQIIRLSEGAASDKPPAWTIDTTKPDSAPGVPTLFVSDLHWGEVVHPSQINGVNKFDIKIAHARMKALAERSVRLLHILSPKMQYPGIVVPLGGDMISGNIHDELTASNELNSAPAVLDLFGVLRGFLTGMADTFGKVFVPCVTGNHGRDTHKIWNKDRHHTSFDWLLYCFLAKSLEGDKRITFLIPDGPDAYYRVYGHRYLLSHGDQFRGGDGMIGALGPIIRGDHKKRSRNAQIDMEYDTLLIGHWHQLIHINRLIVNGSLKGYDEYAYANNFGFERPQQALWITHPKYGKTLSAPVYVDHLRSPPKTEWVSVAA